jgi:hypothetical protein
MSAGHGGDSEENSGCLHVGEWYCLDVEMRCNWYRHTDPSRTTYILSYHLHKTRPQNETAGNKDRAVAMACDLSNGYEIAF